MDNSRRKQDSLMVALVKEITSGDYTFDQRFPGIQQVAQKYQISYLTASRVMKRLTDEGYLRCENGVGHFVNYVSKETPIVHKKVNFIISRDEYLLKKKFIAEAVELFHANGWSVNVLRCPQADITSAAKALNSPDAYSIICGLRIPWQHYQASFGHLAKRLLIIGALAGNSKITSIISNEYEAIQLAVNHFKRKGRSRIAVIVSNPTSELVALRIGAWRSAMLAAGQSYDWVTRHSFDWAHTKENYVVREELARLKVWLEEIRSDTDGLIVSNHHAEVIACCQKCGIRIPDELSLLMISLSTPELPDAGKFIAPGTMPDTEVLDHNYSGHFQCALEILEQRFCTGTNADGYWYFCPTGHIQPCRKMQD